MNNSFNSYLKSFVVKHEITIPYTPQQNGVAERKHKTIVEMARCTLHAKNMSYKFWAETMFCATYLINRTPTKALKDITPEEAWSGRKPNLKHLRIFGSIAYVHTPKEKRKKLDAKSSSHIFVGYDEHSKAYRLYNPLTNKVKVAKDVCIAENDVHDCCKVHDIEPSQNKVIVVEDNPQIESSPNPPNVSPTHNDSENENVENSFSSDDTPTSSKMPK